jgi:hypothetical protein
MSNMQFWDFALGAYHVNMGGVRNFLGSCSEGESVA